MSLRSTCQQPTFGHQIPVDSTATAHTPGTGAGVSIAIIDTGAAAPGVLGERDTCFFHGSAVASVIQSIAPDAQLHSLRHSDDPERMDGTVASLVSALDRAAKLPGTQLINISMVACQDTVELRESVARAQDNGVLIIASTGNTGQCDEGQVPYPAALPGVLGVGAVDPLEPDSPDIGLLPATYSASASHADIFATGGPVSAQVERAQGDTVTVVGTPDPFVGTSFATPIVTATAARVWQILPHASATQIQDILLDTALPGGAGEGMDQPIAVVDTQAAVSRALEIASGGTGEHAVYRPTTPMVTTPLAETQPTNYFVPVAIALVFALVLVVAFVVSMVRRAADSLNSPASGNPEMIRQGTRAGSVNPSEFRS